MSFRLLSLTLGLLASLAAAQSPTSATAPVLPSSSAPADPAQVCATDESLLEIRVGQSVRGTFLTHLVGRDVWLDPKALRPEEAGYFDTKIDCSLSQYVRLLPGLSPTIDPEQLTLTFQPAPQVLAGQSLAVTERPEPSAPTAPLFSIDYVAAVAGNLSTSPSLRGAVRARYLNGPLSALVGAAAESKSGSVQWAPYGQVVWNVSPTASLQLAYKVGYTVDSPSTPLSNLNTFLFTGARAQLSNKPLWVWPALAINLPFQAHLRIRIDGLLIAEYDVAPGPVTLHDLPLRNRQGRIEVEVRDETGTRTVSQNYLFPGTVPGNYTLALDAGFLNDIPYLSGRGRYSLSALLDVEGSSQVIGKAVQAQLRAVLVPDDGRSFSVGMLYDSQQNQPLSVVGSAQLAAAPFTITATAAVPVGDLTQTRLSTSVAYRARKYDVQWGVALSDGLTSLSSSLQGNLRVSSTMTLSPALTVRRGALRAGLTLDYRPNKDLTVRGNGGIGSSGATGALTAQYRLNPTTQLNVLAGKSGAIFNVQYADKVRVDAAIDTQGQLSGAVQGSAYLLPNGVQFSRDNLSGAFVTLETGVPALQIFADGQLKGVTDASGRLVFSVIPGRAVVVRIDANNLPFDITLTSDTQRLNFPGPGSYRLDWRSNFVRSRFVTFRWADGSLAANAEIHFENAEINYTDALGIGFLLVSSQDRQALLISQDKTRSCALTIPAQSEQVTCEPALP